MVTYAYLRASTLSQDINHGVFEIQEYCLKNNLNEVVWIKDQGVSGSKNYKSRKINSILEGLKENDGIIVQELSRLGRGISDIYKMKNIIKKKKAFFISIKENILWGAENNKSNNMKENNGLETIIFTAFFAMFGELERKMISERVKSGIIKKKASNQYGIWGRETIEEYLLMHNVKFWLDRNKRPRWIAQELNLAPTKLYNVIKKIKNKTKL